MSDILVPTPNGQMPCWLAVPPLPDSEPRSGHGAHPHRFPGVVVLHDVAGMTRDHRRQADWLAEAGFLALAVNLYYRGGFPLCLRSIMRDCAARAAFCSTTLRPRAPGSSLSPTAAAKSASSVSAWAADSPSCSSPATASPPPASTTAANSRPRSMTSSKLPAPSSAATAASQDSRKAPPTSCSAPSTAPSSSRCEGIPRRRPLLHEPSPRILHLQRSALSRYRLQRRSHPRRPPPHRCLLPHPPRQLTPPLAFRSLLDSPFR